MLALAAAVLFGPILVGYLQTGLVPRFPTLIVVTGLGISALLSLLTGLLLEAVTLAKRETRRLSYLAIPVFDGEKVPNREQSQ